MSDSVCRNCGSERLMRCVFCQDDGVTEDTNNTITTLRQQLAAAARECEAWRMCWNMNIGEGLSHDDEYESPVIDAKEATDALIPDLAAVAKGGQ